MTRLSHTAFVSATVGTGSIANIGSVSRSFWNGADNQDCSLVTRRIYCVEQ